MEVLSLSNVTHRSKVNSLYSTAYHRERGDVGMSCVLEFPKLIDRFNICYTHSLSRKGVTSRDEPYIKALSKSTFIKVLKLAVSNFLIAKSSLL